MPEDHIALEPATLESALRADLHHLMSGPGAQRSQDASRIGPMLRHMCGIAATDLATGPADAIMAVAAWLRTRIATLDSESQRTCGAFVFGLDEQARFPKLLTRREAAAQRLSCSLPTISRHTTAAITLIARTTAPEDSVLYRLRQHAGLWVELHYVPGTDAAVREARCLLIDSTSLLDWPDKVYALVRFGTDNRAVTAIPALWVRQVTPAQSSNLDTLNVADHQP